MSSKTRAGKKEAQADAPIDDDFPPALPFQLPGDEGTPDKVVLLGVSKDWDVCTTSTLPHSNSWDIVAYIRP